MNLKKYALMTHSFASMLIWICINSILQDVIGKEGCLKRMEANWIDWKISVPISLVVLFIGLWLSKISGETLEGEGGCCGKKRTAKKD